MATVRTLEEWRGVFDDDAAIKALRDDGVDVDTVLNKLALRVTRARAGVTTPSATTHPQKSEALTAQRSVVKVASAPKAPAPTGFHAAWAEGGVFYNLADAPLALQVPVSEWGIVPKRAIRSLYESLHVDRTKPWCLRVVVPPFKVPSPLRRRTSLDESDFDVVAYFSDGTNVQQVRFATNKARRDALAGTRSLQRGDLVELVKWDPHRKQQRLQDGSLKILAVNPIAIFAYVKLTDAPVVITVEATQVYQAVALDPLALFEESSTDEADEAENEAALVVENEVNARAEEENERGERVAPAAAAGAGGGGGSDSDDEESSSSSSNDGMHGSDGADDDIDAWKDDPNTVHYTYTHDGRTVSVHCDGRHCGEADPNSVFDRCVSISICDVALDEMACIARSAATQDTLHRIEEGTLSREAPHLCRNIMYYWIARDVFGRREYVRHPRCCVAFVRSRYPDPFGRYSATFWDDSFIEVEGGEGEEAVDVLDGALDTPSRSSGGDYDSRGNPIVYSEYDSDNE